jgi:hypothetical protein
MSFKIHLFSFVLIISLSPVYSQTTININHDSFEKYLPETIKLQFAGGLGFLSAGMGYSVLNEKLDISVFYGYVPKCFSVKDLHSLNFQITAKLFRVKLSKDIELMPLNIGGYFQHTFGNEYWVKLPDEYPRGYYWWSPGLNTGFCLGAELRTKFLANKINTSSTAFYVNIGSKSYYLASKFGNSSIPLTDIINIGFGIIIYR